MARAHGQHAERCAIHCPGNRPWDIEDSVLSAASNLPSEELRHPSSCSLPACRLRDATGAWRVASRPRSHRPGIDSISDLLYGHFAEFMFENIKQGLWQKFWLTEDVAPSPAAAHYWERYPDTRNHASGFLLAGEA